MGIVELHFPPQSTAPYLKKSRNLLLHRSDLLQRKQKNGFIVSGALVESFLNQFHDPLADHGWLLWFAIEAAVANLGVFCTWSTSEVRNPVIEAPAGPLSLLGYESINQSPCSHAAIEEKNQYNQQETHTSTGGAARWGLMLVVNRSTVSLIDWLF